MNCTKTLPITTPNKDQLDHDAKSVLEIIETFEIDSPEMYEAASGELLEIKSRIKKLEEQRKAITGPLDKAKKEVMDLFRGPLAMLEQSEILLKGRMVAYSNEQKRIAAEKQRLLEEQARKERERLAAEAEAARQAAAEAEAEGDTEAAAELIADAQTAEVTAAMVTAPTVAADVPKAAGISSREHWTAEVTDLHALVRHVASHPEYIGLIEPNMKGITALIRALKDETNIPGVKAIKTEILSARSA